MEQRISLVTLGVGDLAVATAFYEALGWRREASPEGLVAFDLLGQSLALYEKSRLAEDIGVSPTEVGGFSGITLAHNLDDKEGVRAVMARAKAAGAKVLREPSDVFWGGFVGYFADPDGHIWEIAWNPHSPLGPNGEFQWHGVGEAEESD